MPRDFVIPTMTRYGLALVLIAAILFLLKNVPFDWYVLLLFGLSLGIGLLLGRWWALLLCLIPFPVYPAIVGLAMGRNPFTGEAWVPLSLVWILLPGFAGILIGVYIVQSGTLARLLPFDDRR